MKRFIIAVSILMIAGIGLFCTDPLPPKLNPYQSFRTNWFFEPPELRRDTLVSPTSGAAMVSSITITPYMVNQWDEWIVDTSYVEIKMKFTLMNKPEISQEFTILDTTARLQRLMPGDSLWASFDWDLTLQGKRLINYLPPPDPNYPLNRLEWEITRVRLEGTIRLFRNVLPTPLKPREIYILYWVKLT
jgi:hypothetical protein